MDGDLASGPCEHVEIVLFGTDEFYYAASDGTATSTTAPVTITVSSVNDAPQAITETFRIPVDGVLEVDAAAGVLANDIDVDGDSITAALITSTTGGTLAFNEDGSLTYAPNAGFHGTDSFSYVVSDGQTTSQEVTATILVDDLADVADDSFDMEEDTTLAVDAASGVLSNDSDANGDPLTLRLVAEPSHGTVTLNADGSFTYTPDANFYGADALRYVANDGFADSAEATVVITIRPVNDAPVATDDAYSVVAGQELTIAAASGVLANDGDADGDALTVAIDQQPVNGTVTLQADGSFVYVPGASFAEGDSFSYVVGDGSATASATVLLTLDPVDIVQARLEIASEDGTPLDTVAEGESFVVNVYVEDIRDEARGVFAFYFNLLFDASLVAVNGALDYSDDFPNGQRGYVATTGKVPDVGAFAGFTEFGAGEVLLLSVPFVALGDGAAGFQIDTNNLSTGDDTLLFGLNNSVASNQVNFVGASLQITPAGAGEGEASPRATFEQAAAQVFAKEDDWLW